ncbi:hypothetical protein [Paenibacillus sp. P22]|uniref:hypothetical protein n=1 Tax=Paenibacillus sp. P22 TaxID=483908 RepID=UPI00038FF50D|nr:hypothetical protein [Paenibacillus sp. P22]
MFEPDLDRFSQRMPWEMPAPLDRYSSEHEDDWREEEYERQVELGLREPRE